MTKPSKLFVNALDGGGAPSIECKCGKLHMCPDCDHLDEIYEDVNGKLIPWKEYCEKSYAESPDTVRLHWGYDSIEFKELEGKIFVYDCECWEELTRYEDWIWHNRSTISRYVNSRIAKMIKDAEQEKLMNILREDY